MKTSSTKPMRSPMRGLRRILVPTDFSDKAARELRVGLIVMAMQGRTGLKRALLGSTAGRVVRHAPCPVLVVR